MTPLPPAGRTRIAIVADRWPLAAWQASLFRSLAHNHDVSLLACPPGLVGDWLWRRIAARVAALQSDDSVPCGTKFPDTDAALTWCGTAGIDVVIDCVGFVPPRPHGFHQGLWSLVQQDGKSITSSYAFLDQVCQTEPWPAVNLVKDGAAVIATASPRIERGRYAGALDRLLTAASLLPAQALRWNVAGAFRSGTRSGRRPHVVSLAQGFGLSVADRCRQKLSSEAWMIGVINRPIQEVDQASVSSEIHWIGPTGGGRYWADPFADPDDPEMILCEEVIYNDPVGIIKQLTIGDGVGVRAERRLDLGLRGHQSYPFLFRDGPALWLVAETIEAGRVVIYRAGDARGDWSVACVALDDVRAADPTVFFKDGLYWLAYCDQGIGQDDNLCLAFAPAMTGPWTRHPQNPVKIDIRSSRPAGTPFMRDGWLMRPAQDCSRTYGGAIVMNRVNVCTTEYFQEEVVGCLRPPAGSSTPDGLHTISAWGDRTLIDGKTERVNTRVLCFRAARKLRSMRLRTT